MPSNENSPDIQRPQNRNALIWRYMDLTKYLYFIIRRSLFFVRADKLDDPFEGSFPIPDKQKKDIFLGNLASGEHPIPPELLEKMRADDAKITQNMRKDNFLNCWHLADHESMAMWKVYGEQNKAIAIQSTYERLHNAVSQYVTLGLVEYIDYEKGTMFEGKQYGAAHLFFKRKAFEFERELRATMGRWKPGVLDPNKQYDEQEVGWDYLIDPSTIVERVVVSPRMPEWIYSLTVELTHRLGFTFPIERSGLDATPVF
jgi:hypothetical protein